MILWKYHSLNMPSPRVMESKRENMGNLSSSSTLAMDLDDFMFDKGF